MHKDFISAVPHDEPLTKFCTLLTCSVIISTPLDVGMCAKFWLKKKGHSSSHVSHGSNKVKTKLACILEAPESMRLRMGNSVPNYHQDHIAGKEDNLFTALQFGSQI